MPLNYEYVTAQAQEFLTEALSRLEAMGVKLHNWSIDHLCYRVETFERYTELKSSFSTFGRMLNETEINGRPIAVYKLHSPIRHGNRVIELVEIPAPKLGKECTEGFEHLEVILPVPFTCILAHYPDLRFDTAGLTKDYNQDLKLRLDAPDKSADDIVVKFHHMSLESVTNLENNTPVYNALQSCRILQILKRYEPLIAGTYPLNMHVDGSDVDIIAWAHSLKYPQADIRHFYGDLETFRDAMTMVGGRPTYIANFMWDDVPFEIFIQSTPSVKGMAYRHYLIEERLLKINGPEFAEKVKTLRAEHNLKTEPAFAMALGLDDDDPYRALLDLEIAPELPKG